MAQMYRTLRVAESDEGVLSVVIDAPPMNLIGPELVRDLVGLIGALESGQQTRVIVLESADPDCFVPHVDLTKVAEYTAEAAKAGGPDDASLGMLWYKLSELPVVSIAKIRGPGPHGRPVHAGPADPWPLELDLGDRIGAL
jgi:enoyl-CoA hydratase/carnithine racemase